MSNFFYKYSDYSLFQKALKDVEGEDVVANFLSNDDSLKDAGEVETKHIIRKDNRFSDKSSFDRFFGPRKNQGRNVDMGDFSSWKNKNYRETEKQLGKEGENKLKFSFADYMNERSGGKIYNDEDKNREENQKAIEELPSEDSTFKKFSLNDYMRRLEERTRVKSQTRDNEDLIEPLGNLTQDVVPTKAQDENFEENVSNVNLEGFVEDDEFKGDKFAVDTSELDAMKARLEELKTQTEEINEIIDENSQDEETSSDEISIEEVDEAQTESADEAMEEETQEVEKIEETSETQTADETEDEPVPMAQGYGGFTQPAAVAGQPGEAGETAQTGASGDAGGGSGGVSQTGASQGDGSAQTNAAGSQASGGAGGNFVKIISTQTSDGENASAGEEKSQEIIKLIDKNEKERAEIEEQLKQAEKEKLAAMKTYEGRLKELEKSIADKDKETQKRVLLEKIKNDNKLIEVREEYKQREDEIRRLEKEAALKAKIGALLKKELKNNLSISNLEMNNKLLEITTLLNQEKQKAKAARPKTVRKRKNKRKIDSDIIGSIDFD